MTVSPKASETPRKPMPSWTLWPATTLGARNFAAKMALPQPPKTSQKVPSASAPSRELIAGVRITSPIPSGPQAGPGPSTVPYAGGP